MLDRARLSFLLSVLLALGLFSHPVASRADWRADWEKTLAAAKAEGNIWVYGPPGLQYINAIETFKTVYPDIKMVYVPGSGSQHSNRMSAERRAGKFLADAFISGSGTGGILAEKGFFDPLPPQLILPENTDQSLWFRKQHLYADPGKAFIIMQGNVTATIAAYNTQKHKPGELKSFQGLLDLKWRGKMVSFDPLGRGALQLWKGLYYNKNLGPEFIYRLFSEMDVTIGRDFRVAVDWVASGKYELFIAARDTEVGDAMKKGLPIDLYRAPADEGYLSGGFGHLGSMNRAPHPNAARVFVNWMLSKEGQLAWQAKSDNNSLRMDISKDMLTDKFIIPEADGGYLVPSLPEYQDVSGLRKILAKAKAGAAKRYGKGR
ncbi:MAG TPA: extracellular solute-binding protein [Candidatus Binatia bacterium]